MSESITLPPTNPEAEHQKPVDWDNVFEAVNQVGLPLDRVERSKDVANMTGADLAMMTAVFHAVLAPGEEPSPSSEARFIVDPKTGGEVATSISPEQRLPLYEYAAELIHGLAKDMEGKEEMFLKRAGNILAITTLAAHPFEDGNGRTARFVSHLIRHAESNSLDEIEELKMLGTNRPVDGGYRVISYVPKDKDIDLKTLLDSAASLEIPLDDPESYKAATQQVFTTPYPEQ